MTAYVSFWKAKKPRLTTPTATRAAYAIADKHHSRFKRAYRAALEEVKTPELITALSAAVRNKSLIGVDLLIPAYDLRDPEAAARWAEAHDILEARYQAILRESGKKALADIDVNMSFRLLNDGALTWANTQAGALIRDVSTQARQNIQQLIYQSFADGVAPQTTKAMVANHIGLLPREASAVERRLANAIEQGVPESRASQMAQKYADKLLGARAERITRTETITAEAQGQISAWQEASQAGFIVAGTRREWVSSSEANGSCLPCAELDGEKVDFDIPFQTRYGPKMAPPIHPSCRCTVVLVPPDER
jgi:hypothetical protein